MAMRRWKSSWRSSWSVRVDVVVFGVVDSYSEALHSLKSLKLDGRSGGHHEVQSRNGVEARRGWQADVAVVVLDGLEQTMDGWNRIG